MEILMFLALPLMMLGGFALNATISDDDDDREVETESADPDPII